VRSTGCPETSVRKYTPILRIIPKDCRSHLHHGGSIECRNSAHISLPCMPHAHPIPSALSFSSQCMVSLLYAIEGCCPFCVDVTSHTELCRWVRGVPEGCCPLCVDVTLHTELCRWVRGVPDAKERTRHTCPCPSAGDKHVDRG